MSQASATKVAIKEVSARKFTMRGLPMLASGISTDPVTWCDGLWIHAKVYSRGGENALHAHTDEAHAFFVLQGEAMFSFGDGSTTHVSQYEGVMLPRNAMYCFEAQGDDCLVMMRIGAAETRPEPYTESYELRDLGDGMTSIIDATGKPMAGKNKGTAPNEVVIPIPNAFFPRDDV